MWTASPASRRSGKLFLTWHGAERTLYMLKNRPFTFSIRKWGQIPEYMQEFLVDIKAEFDNYRSFLGQSEENGPKLPWIVERMVVCLKYDHVSVRIHDWKT